MLVAPIIPFNGSDPVAKNPTNGTGHKQTGVFTLRPELIVLCLDCLSTVSISSRFLPTHKRSWVFQAMRAAQSGCSQVRSPKYLVHTARRLETENTDPSENVAAKGSGRTAGPAQL